MQLRVNALGQFEVALDGHSVAAAAWRRARSAALVKLLALARGHRLHREQAIDALWPELSPEAGSANLRKAVHFARRTLGARDLIMFDGSSVALAPGHDLVVDAELFEAEAKAALQGRDQAALARVADLYRGDLLPDDRYAEWADGPREHLRQLYARVLRAGRLFDRLIEFDPADEEAQRAVMQVALDAGNRGEVIRRFQRVRERLRVDLGVGPAASTIAIYERALEQESAVTPSIADRVRASLAWGIIHLHSGDLAKAAEIARQARQLALQGGLGREIGEASALFGMVAHMQGRWPDVFRSEFTAWIREAPAAVSNVFDGHLCLAEFCLCGAAGHEGIAQAARELLTVAERAGSVPGRALATLILGEAALFGGQLDTAEQLLSDAGRLHEEAGAVAGRVLSLQRLAEVALARGQRYRAGRLMQKGMRLAETSWLAPHLVIRLQTLMVAGAASKARAAEAITQGDRWLAGHSACQPCSMGFRIASAIALAEAGDHDGAGRRLDEAERLAGMWNGGPWLAAVWEARGVLRRAQGHETQGAALLREAAERYRELGRMGDEKRCEERLAGAHSGAGRF
jgi:DNA-binding SARP family transcriptional activator